jgi:hypothetical protein
MAATMPQNTKTNNEVTCLLSSETPVLSALPEQSKPIPVKAISAACGISVDVGALAGSVASLLLLGAFSPFATLLSISIVSVKLQRTSLGELCAFLYGGGLAGCQGLLITVLSLMSLSAALGKYGTRSRYCSEAGYSETVEPSFRILLSKLIIYIRGDYILLAGLSFATAKKPTVRSSTLSNLLIRLSRSAAQATLHIPSLNRGPSRLQSTFGRFGAHLPAHVTAQLYQRYHTRAQ